MTGIDRAPTSGKRRTAARKVGRAAASAALLGASISLGCTSEGVSYSRDVAPLLARRCVPCHNSAAKGGRRDLEDPFTLDADSPGMFVATNDWNDADSAHAGHSLAYNVVPFHPEESFLMEKITNRSLLPENYDVATCTPLTLDRSVPLPPECVAFDEGGFMPAQQSFPAEQLAFLREWITDGADETEFYEKRLTYTPVNSPRPITVTVSQMFGDPTQYIAAPCGYCHYPGGPETPDFSNPFDPVTGMVNVSAHFRTDLKLIQPGSPDASLVVLKLQATEPSSEIGSPMPRNFEPLSSEQAALIARWIAEGAKRN
jgi:hypothetical protein